MAQDNAPLFEGTSTAATGTINNGSASTLSFPSAKHHGFLNNLSGQRVYYRLNDPAGTPLISATVYDSFLADGERIIWTDVAVTTIGIFVAATSGVRAVGW